MESPRQEWRDGRKRVVKACDRCRLKKIKCCGAMPCDRCQSDDAVCHFGDRRKLDDKPISSAHLNQLQRQQDILVKALRQIWRTHVNKDGDSAEIPSVHAIVKATGVVEDEQEAAAADQLPSGQSHVNHRSSSMDPRVDEMSPVGGSSGEELDCSRNGSDASYGTPATSFESSSLHGLQNELPQQSFDADMTNVSSLMSLGRSDGTSLFVPPTKDMRQLPASSSAGGVILDDPNQHKYIDSTVTRRNINDTMFYPMPPSIYTDMAAPLEPFSASPSRDPQIVDVSWFPSDMINMQYTS